MEQQLRIHVYLAHLGIASRRKAEELIREGKVEVNNQVAQIGQLIIPGRDQVKVDGKIVGGAEEAKVYLLVYKPRGYVSTAQDELGRKKVTDLIPAKYGRVYPVGRLDLESEGLILMTNDGDLAYIMTHPKFEVEKRYNVLIERVPTTLALQHLRRGVLLKEGFARAKSLKVMGHEDQARTWMEIVITEGRNQQVRRMFKRVGYETLDLIRVAMGPLELGKLQKGQFRELKQPEIDQLLLFVEEKKNRNN